MQSIHAGFEEATVCSYGVESVNIKKRKGFIKYALQYGYRVHPVYTFGECDTYYTFSHFKSFRLWLNKFQVPAVVFFGYPICPLLPHPSCELHTVVGDPLELPCIPKPSKEDVEKFHALYVKALQNTFDKYKKDAGKPDAVLQVW